jgi:hypothetical protein
VVTGETGACAVCRVPCDQWWCGADFYACVHKHCRGDLTILEGRGVATDTASVRVRHGAYARRAGVAQESWFTPSRWRGEGKWVALAETSAGQMVVPCGGNAGHGVYVLRFWEALTTHGMPVRSGGVEALGASLLDPTGVALRSWGAPPALGTPRWSPLRQASAWGECGCGSHIWPGRWVDVERGRCRWCCGGDDRPWPVDSDFP